MEKGLKLEKARNRERHTAYWIGVAEAGKAAKRVEAEASKNANRGNTKKAQRRAT